jgi:photosystem II stability/assembly factor-like uncharacterized protein
VILPLLVAAASLGGAATPVEAMPGSLAFWTARAGVIGGGGRGCPDRCGGTISLTADGGLTSRIVLRTRGPVLSVATAGTSDAWAVVGRCGANACGADALLHSADRGRVWHLVRHAAPSGPSFASRRLGLAVADGVDPTALVVTHDGGRVWEPTRSPCGRWAVSAAIAYPTAARAWVLCAGQGAAGNSDKAVYQSSDRGRTWQPVAETLVGEHRVHGGIGAYGYPQGIAFASNGSGLLWESRGTLYATANGGRRWRALTHVAEPEIDFGQSAWVLPDGHRFALLWRGADAHTELLLVGDRGGWRVVRHYALR